MKRERERERERESLTILGKGILLSWNCVYCNNSKLSEAFWLDDEGDAGEIWLTATVASGLQDVDIGLLALRWDFDLKLII